MLDRLPTLPGLPPVRLPPDALTHDQDSKQVAFNQTSFLLILSLTALQTSYCDPDCLCPGYGAAQGAAHEMEPPCVRCRLALC